MKNLLIISLVSVGLLFAGSKICGASNCFKGSAKTLSATTSTSDTAKYKVVKLKPTGLTCPMCEKGIEQKLLQQNGVVVAKANYDAQTVEIKYDAAKINLQNINHALAAWNTDHKQMVADKSKTKECTSGAGCEKQAGAKKSCCSKE